MTLPEINWFTIAEVATRWETTEDSIEHFLLTDKLNASVNLPIKMLQKCKVEYDGEDFTHEGFSESLVYGIYNITNYSSLKWNKSEDGTKYADLCGKYIYLYNDECIGFNRCDGDAACEYKYRFRQSYLIEKNDIVITRQEVKRFETEHCLTIKTESANNKAVEPYLDPKHEYYSDELAIAVKVWLILYADGGKYKATKDSHKKQIKAELNNNGLSSAAIERIATLVNPNKNGGAPITY